MNSLRLYIRWTPVSNLSKPYGGVFLFEKEGSVIEVHEALSLWSEDKARNLGMQYEEFKNNFIIEYQALTSLSCGDYSLNKLGDVR